MTRGLQNGGRESGGGLGGRAGAPESRVDGLQCSVSLEPSDASSDEQLWWAGGGFLCNQEINALVFDRAVLDELASMLDDAEIDAYLALLEPTVAPRVAALLRQVEAGEINGMVETAHALAGGAACYGLSALSAAARMVEYGARSEPQAALCRVIGAAAGLVEMSLSAVFRWRLQSRAERVPRV